MQRPPGLVLLALGSILLAPLAAAHTAYFTDDDRYRIVTGQLQEPVYTYTKTGLDLCFTQNTTAREPVTVNPGALTATLVAPDGQTLSQPLRAQHGRPGCYQFQEGYVLTQPGQYTIDLRGDVNGTTVDMTGMVAGGAVDAMEDVTFPDAAVPTNADLRDRLAALETRLALAEQENGDLQSRLDAVEDDDGTRGSPAAPAVLLLLALVGLALLRRKSA